MNMDLVFPEDDADVVARSGRNISGLEKWVSIAAGTGLALYGLSRLRGNGWLLAGAGGLLLRRGITAHCDVYEAFGVNTAVSPQNTRASLGGPRGINVLESVTIHRSLEELYRFWRNLENLPQFMRHLASVDKITDTISHWRARGPASMVVEWDAEIYNEVANKLIAWRSLEGADVVSAGSVNFARTANGMGTRVTVHLQYSPPLGKLGAAVAKIFGADAASEIREDLQRFKQMVESGQKA
ncbi:MAG TPA: SRPBCC family protein [Vicinamibacterales bacterium]|jgi:uncharacterized membrane protein